MMTTSLLSPQRFRRRLTIVCILVAGISAGFLALTSYIVMREYRNRTFADQAAHRVDLALLALPDSVDASRVEAALAAYRERGGFETVAVTDDKVYSSASTLDLRAVPSAIRAPRSGSDLPPARTSVDGSRYLVIARQSDDGRTSLFFFFALADIQSSIDQLRNVIALAWLATVLLAAVFGAAIARRALRPVGAAAQAARATALRLLGRVPLGTDDEFDQWAASFNELVAALEAKIVDLSDAAQRERQFTSDVAHELRTPLTGLLSAASLLREHLDELPDPARRPAALLVGDVQRLHSLVLELLELARLDAGAEPVTLQPLELAPALAAAAEPWTAQSARLRVDCEPGLCVLSDRQRFKRVIANLLDNAIRHGGGDVTIHARRELRFARVEVVDAGPGVGLADAEHVFERFYKADVGRATRGSGLGLAIAYEHACAIGGSLQLANPGEPGARFVFSLPLGNLDPHDSSVNGLVAT